MITSLVIDGTIILAYFIGIVTLGLYLGRREGSLKEFALGGRSVPWWAVMASIIAAETSAATFLGTPGEGYKLHNFAYVQLIAGLIIGRVLVGVIFLKPYFDYKVYTVYDYLGIRFGPRSRAYTSSLFLIMRTLASGTRLFVPSLVMVLAWQWFSGGGNSVSFAQVNTITPYIVAITALTIITCVYTAIGGIKAVIWTDVVQATLMFAGALIAIGTLLYHLGGHSWNLFDGLRALVHSVPEMGRPSQWFIYGWEDSLVAEYKAPALPAWVMPRVLWVEAWKSVPGGLDMTAWEWVKLTLLSPYTLASALIASTAGNMAQFGTDQDMVQRMLAAETHKKARRSLITAAVMDLPIAAAFVFIGILLFAYYELDPKFKPRSPQDVFGSYIINVLPTGIRGLVLAGVFATAMGSLSAALNALATSATNDWYLRRTKPGEREQNAVRAARWFTALFAILMIVIACAFAYGKVRNPDLRIIPVVLGISGFIVGPMLGVFLLGMLTRRRGNDRWNVVALTAGLLSTIYFGGIHNELLKLLGLASLTRPPVVEMSWSWFALIGATVVFVIGLFASTPQHVLDKAKFRREQAKTDDRPMAMRD